MKKVVLSALALGFLATCSYAADGEALFKKCAACHGKAGEKKALGKSEIIAGLDAAEVKKMLKGYQDGSFGGAAKATMAGQVKKLSDEDIDALAEYVSTLGK